MGLIIIDENNCEIEDTPLYEAHSLLDVMKLEHVAKVLNQYSLSEIETLIPDKNEIIKRS